MTDPINLPPLPEQDCCTHVTDSETMDLFRADQMRDYALAAIQAHMAEREAQPNAKELEAEAATFQMKYRMETDVENKALFIRAEHAEARCAELEKAAERYKWLREVDSSVIDELRWDELPTSRLDAAIDSAMNKYKPLTFDDLIQRGKYDGQEAFDRDVYEQMKDKILGSEADAAIDEVMKELKSTSKEK